MDNNTLRKKLKEYNAMILSTLGNTLIFVSPKKVPEDFKTEVINFFPEMPIKFMLAMKPSTMSLFSEIMKASGTITTSDTFKIEERTLTITLEENANETVINAIIKALKNAVEDDGYIEVLKFNIGGEETTYNLGKPLIISNHERVEPITKADIMDLNIVLETCNDVNELLEVI